MFLLVFVYVIVYISCLTIYWQLNKQTIEQNVTDNYIREHYNKQNVTNFYAKKQLNKTLWSFFYGVYLHNHL